jgi:two-component system, sensor histidine kinase LadS
MHHSLIRAVAIFTTWLALGAQLAWAQPSVVQAPSSTLVLSAAIASFTLPLQAQLNPDTIWQSEPDPFALRPTTNQGEWFVTAEQRTAAKFTLNANKYSIYTLEVPLVRMDLVQLFWRSPGGAWKTAQAGDTVALPNWPVVGQFATFVLHFEEQQQQMDLIVVMQNAGNARVAVMLHSDNESRERRLLQANTAGLLIGASLMVLLVNVLLFLMYRNTATVHLMMYCACVTLGTALITGYAAIWFTPQWPLFNDASKPFVASLISASIISAGLAALDRTMLGRKWRSFGYAVAMVIVALGVVQLLLLPNVWRMLVSTGSAALAISTLMLLGARNWRLGDRYARWIIFAALLFALCTFVVGRGSLLINGMDFFAAVMALTLIASSLMLRHVLVMKERFGRAVQSRAEVTRFRDPLTALLSYEGFERAVDTMAVSQQGNSGAAQLLYFSLTELDNFRHEDGYIVWQRDLVRFAAVLQKALGEDWKIARLSNSKFGAVSLDDRAATTKIDALLTLVLSSCTRKIDTQGWVDRVGLRMAGVNTQLSSDGLKESLRSLEQAVRELGANKRIALL